MSSVVRHGSCNEVECRFRFKKERGILGATKLINETIVVRNMHTDARRERKDALRNMELVLRAAHELFAERGTDVTMEEVARRAGVGVGTVYRRFPSKEQLWSAVSLAACAHTQHCIHEATQAEPDPVRKLRALIMVQYRRSEEQAALLDQSAERAHEPSQLYTALHALLQQMIVEGQQQGRIRAGDPAVLAALCLELLNPRTFQNLQRVVGGCAEDSAEHTVRFVLQGLGVRL